MKTTEKSEDKEARRVNHRIRYLQEKKRRTGDEEKRLRKGVRLPSLPVVRARVPTVVPPLPHPSCFISLHPESQTTSCNSVWRSCQATTHTQPQRERELHNRPLTHAYTLLRCIQSDLRVQGSLSFPISRTSLRFTWAHSFTNVREDRRKKKSDGRKRRGRLEACKDRCCVVGQSELWGLSAVD